jgi:hypothetical protein
MRGMKKPCLLGLMGFLAACGGTTTSTLGDATPKDASNDAGTPADSGGGGSDATTGGGDFASVQAIFTSRCIICHDKTKPGLPAYPALSLTEGDAYNALVNHPADAACGGKRVVPGDPNASFLVQKLTQTMPCFGSRMPRPFEVGPTVPLTADQIATITRWISSGAPQ